MNPADASLAPGGAPPEHGAPGEESLAPCALTYLNVREGTLTVVVALVLCVTTILVFETTWRAPACGLIASLSVLAMAVELPWLNRREVRNTTYTVTRDFVYVTHGWLWRRSTVIATAQILNVEIAQGPLLRAFDAVSVRFTCIADVQRLGPLKKDAAERIRLTVLQGQRTSPC